MMYNKEHCLHNESGLAWGESREGGTHESNIKSVTGQLEFLCWALQLCEAWKMLVSLLLENWGCPNQCLL
jgi:hypothetical protein